VNFYGLGYDRPDLRTLAGHYNLDGIVNEFNIVDYKKAAEIQLSSDMLLFVQWCGKGSDGWYSAKLYDYIGAHRPILALAQKDGILAKLITKTSSGVVAASDEEIRATIKRFYDEFIRSGNVRYDGDEIEIAKLSRAVRAKELATLFDSLIGRSKDE